MVGWSLQMLHTKFRGNRSSGSGEEDFWRVFTIYGRGGHLGHVTKMPRTNFCSPYLRRLHIKFDFDWSSGFGEEDVWNCGRRRTDGRTTDGRQSKGILKAHQWAFGSGELKRGGNNGWVGKQSCLPTQPLFPPSFLTEKKKGKITHLLNFLTIFMEN